MANFVLYGPALSTYVRTVRMIFTEANTPYELKPVDIFTGEQNSPDYLAKHPFGKVPTLEIDGQYLYETCAIAEYLDAAVNNNGLTPDDLMAQAHMRQIMAIVDSYLYPPAITTITIQRLIVPSRGGQTDEAAVAAAVPKVQTALKAIEAIAACSPYLLGAELTLADLYLLPVVLYLSNTPDWEAVISETPQLKAWWETASQLPSFKQVLK
ncbi:glutathione S-transferase family protein [Halomicronema sp. CCY15110]|uniref:glutathione S-transferase family protein n=1 Tax=Halomicronema sp. CCY15110 TaxID=2767773 RepID=UPI00194E4803|nr:glutathione S-transferase family protein [Halomicronema sp. CCY15110]